MASGDLGHHARGDGSSPVERASAARAATQLASVAYRFTMETRCLLTNTPDVNQVTVRFTPPPPAFVEAGYLRGLAVGRHEGMTITAEDLAVAVAADIYAEYGSPLTVTVSQREGHGVEATAVAGEPGEGHPPGPGGRRRQA